MEYEVARILVKYGFSVDADYSYSKHDAGVEKDFSVDIRATAFPPYDTDDIHATVDLLVECKHRHRGNKWLFFPDPNEPDMSPFTLGYTLRAVDQFSWKFLPSGCTDSFDEVSICCMKGVEVDGSTGNVHDSEIRHGLTQLQYALPRLVTDQISFAIHHPKDENDPFFFCPILLTMSTLLVANETTSIKTVEDADTLEDFSSVAPWVVVHCDLTPDFERHRQRECAALAPLVDDAWVKQIDEARLRGGEYDFRIPSHSCAALAGPVGVRLFEYFSQAVVCSFAHFPALLELIKEITDRAAKSQSESAERKTRV